MGPSGRQVRWPATGCEITKEFGTSWSSDCQVQGDKDLANYFRPLPDGYWTVSPLGWEMNPYPKIPRAGRPRIAGDGTPVDQYLVRQGFAVNGIDASARMIERARRNVPEGFYEVKDMVYLKEGEYCVDGVVSLRAMLHIPRADSPALLRNFTSFMPNGGALLLTMRSDGWRQPGDGAPGASASWHHAGVGSNAHVVEVAGFSIVLNDNYGSGDDKHQVILARS